MRRRFGTPRFQLHRGEARLQEAETQSRQVQDLRFRTPGRNLGRHRPRHYARNGIRGSLVRRELAHGRGSGLPNFRSERKEAYGLIRAGGGSFNLNQARERSGKLPHDGNARRERFRPLPCGTGFRDEPDGRAYGRTRHERIVKRRLADLSVLSGLFMKNRVLFDQGDVFRANSFGRNVRIARSRRRRRGRILILGRRCRRRRRIRQ